MSYTCSALQIVTWLWSVVQSSPTGVCQHLSVYCMSLTESGSWCGQCGQRMKQPFPDYFCISHPTACSSGWKTAWPERIGKPHTMDMTLLASGRPANIKLGSLELHSLSFMHVKGVSGFPLSFSKRFPHKVQLQTQRSQLSASFQGKAVDVACHPA